MATCQPREHFLCIDQLSKSKGSKLLNNHGMSRMILVAVPTSSPDIWGPEVVNVHDGDDDGLVKRRPIRWSLYWYLDFCDDHLSQNPDNRETGYSHVPVMDKAKHILTQEKKQKQTCCQCWRSCRTSKLCLPAARSGSLARESQTQEQNLKYVFTSKSIYQSIQYW